MSNILIKNIIYSFKSVIFVVTSSNCENIIYIGPISEITSIVDDVVTCKRSKFSDDFALSEKSFTNFEQLRRNFELTTTQLNRLVCDAIDSKLEALQHKSAKECEPEHDAKAVIPLDHEAKKLKLEEFTEKLQADVEVLKSNDDMPKLSSC